MAYSIREAAELAGVSKSTIQRQLKKQGGLSKNEDGKIEGSELARVYPTVISKLDAPEAVNTPEHSQGVPVGQRGHSQVNTGGTLNEHTEISVLQAKLEAAELRLSDRDDELQRTQETITDLRDRLDEANQERREAVTKLTALLKDHRPEALKEKPSRWRWLRRRA